MFKFSRSVAALLISLTAFCGWKFHSVLGLDGLLGLDNSPPAASDDSLIRVASFNIQVFGQSKLAKPDVMSVLAAVVRRFDVVAIQEIRSKEPVLPQFVEEINSAGRHYKFVIGPRLGRSISKEQYAYIYDATRVELLPDSVYTVNDPKDMLHREPLIARFRIRGPPADEAMTFTLINIHTDPDLVKKEINVLDNVWEAVLRDGSGEDDVIMLGDFNASEAQLGELNRVPNLKWAIAGKPTNTRRTKTYDNILFDGRRTAEFAGRSGVLDLMQEFGMTRQKALRVSDHFPVWAEFQPIESRRQRIAGSGNEARD